MSRDSVIISVLTCTPGNEMYSMFGHTAFRVQTPDNDDIVFNFGTFDFESPGFYWNFIKGKLTYFLSISTFEEFVFIYLLEDRGIYEQVLNLNREEADKLAWYLWEIYQSEERYYKYDYFDNNCSTKIIDVLNKVVGNKLTEPKEKKLKTYRNLVREYSFYHPWSWFGLDLLFGLPADEMATEREACFLPDYLAGYLEKSKIRDDSLVLETREIEDAGIFPGRAFYTPFLVFVLVLIVILGFYRFKLERMLVFPRIIYIVLISFLLILLLFLWVFTDHQATSFNPDLLWLSAISVIIGLRERLNTRSKGAIAFFSGITTLGFVIAGFCNITVIPFFLSGLLLSKP